ncbi:MAG: alpha/beta-type small acid-soluble spore protein [Clostridiales bacterium]|nr:alpha/beta-type small acid-soluble spore protein [Clostridiales bacterium]
MPNRKTGSKRNLVPEAKGALDNMKFEIANQMGVDLKQGYNGDLTAREVGSIGGEMVRRMIQDVQNQMSGQSRH